MINFEVVSLFPVNVMFLADLEAIVISAKCKMKILLSKGILTSWTKVK